MKGKLIVVYGDVVADRFIYRDAEAHFA